MSEVDFSKLNKITAKSFNDQKAIIKKVMLGREVKCKVCQKALILVPPTSSKSSAKATPQSGIYCPNGCTDIELDMI
ncbi:hypothetical protein RGQ13_04225 [Thalassotalea psychrophila]|uniref:Uncharacterized protein n=1 Tax=Thalassotalea psychrophila TaxID=3065647 RepID=A0ABY9TWH2_9GAMM|nr:hypothetical protein RGQ13_04225 [Colwelliaceae bacterium SQ149]